MPIKVKKEVTTTSVERSYIVSIEENSPEKRVKSEKNYECLLDAIKSKYESAESIDLTNVTEIKQCCVFRNGWRENLCKCDKCLKMYKENEIEFLLDPKDKIQYYEGKIFKNNLQNLNYLS